MIIFTIIITHVLFNLAKCQPHKLYEHINTRYVFFSKKTAYSYVSAVAPYPEPNCKVLQLWMLSRHGTRNPELDTIQSFSNLTQYQNINHEKSNLSKEEIDSLISWKSTWVNEEAGVLNYQGIHDMRSLGQRLRNSYREIFNEIYNTNNFTVVSSPQQRSYDSTCTFLNAAFDMDVKALGIIEMRTNDNRFNIFTRIIKKESTHVNMFLGGPEIKQLVKNVTKAMGLDTTLSFDIVKLMYEACRVQKSSEINFNSPWCAVFSETDLRIIEYYYDLKLYYSNGYGNPQYSQLSAEILSDLLKHLRRAANRQPGPKGVFYFGHTSNLLSILIGIGFAKDESDILSTNFNSMHDRNWRMSYLDPFAANVRAVLYDCGDDNKKVTLFVNDVPVYIKEFNCTLCSWKSIENMFEKILLDIYISE